MGVGFWLICIFHIAQIIINSSQIMKTGIPLSFRTNIQDLATALDFCCGAHSSETRMLQFWWAYIDRWIMWHAVYCSLAFCPPKIKNIEFRIHIFPVFRRLNSRSIWQKPRHQRKIVLEQILSLLCLHRQDSSMPSSKRKQLIQLLLILGIEVEQQWDLWLNSCENEASGKKHFFPSCIYTCFSSWWRESRLHNLGTAAISKSKSKYFYT